MFTDLNPSTVNCTPVKRCVRACSSTPDTRIISTPVKRCVRACSSTPETERISRLYYTLLYHENDIFYIFNKKKAINSVIFETILARQLEISVGENMNGPQKQKWCKYAKYFEELCFTTCTIYKDPCKYFFLPFKRKCCKYMYQ